MVTQPKLQPDRAVILRHLEHITRRWAELPEPALLELVFLTRDNKARVHSVMHFAPDQMGLDLAADTAVGMNTSLVNVYATVNPVSATNRPPANRRASREHIIASFYHWADADSAEAAANIKNFVGPKPTFIVVTGRTPCTRPHVYWELEDAIRNWPAWEQTQRNIAATLGTDPSVTDPPRIMRIAGSVNWPKPQKQAKGYTAEICELRIYDDRDLVAPETIARAFAGAHKANTATSDGFHIDTGEQQRTAQDYADLLTRARTDGHKHAAVRDLAASLAAQGVKRALAEAIIRNACPVWDHNVEDLIDSAYVKFWQEGPAPIEPTPQAITDFAIDSSASFLADLRPLEYLIDGILPTGVAYSLTGFPGHGKTTLALQFALSVALGEPFADRATSKGSVLILAGENPYNVKWQYAAALAARNITPAEADIHFIQGRFSIKQWTEVLRAKLAAMPTLKLIIVDSLQAFFEGDNDNDNTQMVEMAHALRGIADVPQRPALLIIAHPAGKLPSKENIVPRGGGAFLAEIDGNLTVWSQDASQQTLHHSPKFRGAGFDPIEWVMQVHEFSHLTDVHGTPLKLPVSRPEMTIERANREAAADGILRQYLHTVEAGAPMSVREGAAHFRVSRWRMQQVIETAKDEKLIRRHAKTWVITDGGKDFLEANDAGV